MRRKVFLIIAALAVILILWRLFEYLNASSITINSDNPHSLITISRADGPQTNFKQANHTLSFRAKSGPYLVSVKVNSAVTAQIINLKAHQSRHYLINPVTTTGVEPVINQSAYSITSDSSHLLYVNSQDQHLYQIDNQDNIKLVDANHSFRTIRWIDPTYGVGQDLNGQLYVINNGSAGSLNLAYKNITAFDVSTDKHIYFSSGHDIYSGMANRQFEKLYSGEDTFSMLVATSESVAAIISPDARENNPQSLAASTTVISRNGTVVSKNIDTSVGAWSPNGQYLAISTTRGGKVLNKSLAEAALIPSSSVVNPVWLNDTTLLYSNADQLWRYDLNSQRSQLIANMPLGGRVIGLTINSDKSYAYLIISQANGGVVIKRVALQAQSGPAFLYQLQSILPLNVGGCTLSLVNFNQPTVVVQALDAAPQQCQQTAPTELQQRGFNLNLLRLRFTAANLGE